MNERYSSWAARNTPEELPLAARYQSADPIRWHGSMVYPMYTEQVGPAPTTVTLTMISAAPPAGLRGLGMGLSVVDGHLDLHGRSLAGVDAWSDALAAGVSFDVTPAAPVTLVTLTPVWVDEFGTQKSWAGNYGIVVEHQPNGRVVLWCSIGEGPPNFANLVVEVSTAPTPLAPEPSAAATPATTPIGMSPTPSLSASSAGPPTAPTMPVPRIDATAASLEPAAAVEWLAADPSAAVGGGNGQASQSTRPRRAGSLFPNLQSSRAARSTPEAPHSASGSPSPDNPQAAPSLFAGQSATDVAHSGPDPRTADSRSEVNGVWRNPQTHAELPAQGFYIRPRTERSTADSYGAFGPPVAHTHPPEDPARPVAAPLIGNTPPAPEFPPIPRPGADGPRTGSSPLVANPWSAPDPFRAFARNGGHTRSQAEISPPASAPPQEDPHPAEPSPGSATSRSAAKGPHTDSGSPVADPRTAADPYRAFDPIGTHPQPVADTPLADPGAAKPNPAPDVSEFSGQPVSQTAPPAANTPAGVIGPLVTSTPPAASTPIAAPGIQPDAPQASDGLPRLAEHPAPVDAPPRASEEKQSGDPGYRGALYDLGVAMYRRGEEDQACGLWAQASEAGHAGAAYELGMVRLRRGDPVGAESWWRTAADRREPRAIAELADLLDQLGKHAEAKSWRTFAAELQDADVVGQPTSP
ncbi:tetratricopeptide repeat protein [Nocardia arthritidis]|uniref:tetratricopeptide repeat protein n=1 Tax=Nocardia arthritidis TaxID=228602 RepID=UPI0007A4964D|nr:hypothetical protein [Nocardia arthritidis]